jgi:thiol-disulfide isomerase/thioredoxin
MIPLIENLDIVKGRREQIIIWFTVPNCPPCRAIEPRVNEVVKKHPNEFRIFRFDITKNPVIPQELDITSTPTFIFYKGGREIGRLDGFPTLKEFEIILKNALNGGDIGEGKKN